MADLLGSDFGLAETHKLYACHDLLLAHKDALFSHLTERWRDLTGRVSAAIGKIMRHAHENARFSAKWEQAKCGS
jgi:chorismate-pyruvate lyase